MPFTPDVWHHPLWQSTADTLGIALDGRVSLDSVNTVSALVRLLTYGGIFWISLQYSRDPMRAEQVFFALAAAGLVYGAYGLVVQFSGSETILWYDKVAYEGDLTSTFVNRNFYATYTGLTLLCATGLIVNIVSKHETSGALQGQFLQIIESMNVRSLTLMLAWPTGVAALILTHSRGGFLSAGLGLLTLVITLGLSRVIKLRNALVFGAATILAGLVFLTVSGEVLDQRLATMSLDYGARLEVYDLTMDAIEASPILGTGYGSFAEIFQLYRRDDMIDTWQMAHNTYLENTLELGYPAAMGLFAAFACLAVLNFKGLRRRRQGVIYPCTGLAATILVASHSMVDFSLQIPAVAATYALLMGASCAQSWNSERTQDPW